ncbi:hypothetical protein IV38_GL000653 [Lactobacillus selangorensis]|uniref:Zinc-ribbon domain-containing protein n=1 Tax=Lactobacillus selangorensis TaxID=81857 RepID=A0A0R2FXY8_9LACO|nr:hypothetical protein [Lactobacillus selangorensis]KRN29764.1 hypothetical protein IV38_GL000653 [Lactobacillus selangorensis]KRN33707.1 hypothetical protein IV40_GL000015 [Lactobacillus selangorensis]
MTEPSAAEATVQPEFECPVCQHEMEYGLKDCPHCGIQIYYRNLSETFWNQRKLRLLAQSSAISQ